MHLAGFWAFTRSVELYQRAVVALIRATGARLAVLHDHRLVDLWREYSARQYRGGWIKANRVEVFRFITWSNHLPGLSLEITRHLRVHGRERVSRKG